MSVIAYLNFDGNAAEAIDFYAEAFESEQVKKVTFGAFPQDPNNPLSAEEQAMVMESSISIAEGVIMASDLLPSMKSFTGDFVKGNNQLISIVIEDQALMASYFNSLSSGGFVIMPLSSTPWSTCFGMLVDKFGVTWKFNSDAFKFLDRF